MGPQEAGTGHDYLVSPRVVQIVVSVAVRLDVSAHPLSPSPESCECTAATTQVPSSL
jgi:hypothetical protein